MVREDSITRETQRSRLHLALREARNFIARRNFWLLHGGGIVMAAVAGPFYTLNSLSFTGRLIYWTVVILVVGIVVAVFSSLARALNRDAGGRDRLPWQVPVTAAALAVVPVGLGIVWLMNTHFIGIPDDLPGWQLLSFVAVPTVILNLIVQGRSEASLRDLRRRRAFDAQFGPRFPSARPEARAVAAAEAVPGGDATPPSPRPETAPALPVVVASSPEPALPEPLLFEKLAPALGRELICLQAQDHYVEATTTRGSEQVLMRLSDAERDLSQFHGMRVHRSWWVNLAHVTDMARTENGGTELTTTNGLTIPVSRGQKAALRDALDQRRRAAE